jgi:hypothetical protein
MSQKTNLNAEWIVRPTLRHRLELSKITYANVVSTIALFAALGGASYAAVVLPAGSVGPQQIRSGAVALRTLAFPIGVASTTDEQTETINEGACNGGERGATPPPCPPTLLIAPNAARETHIFFSASGYALLADTVTITNDGPSNTRARVTLAATLDGHLATKSRVTVAGGETVQAPLQALVKAKRGNHIAAVDTGVEFETKEPGQVAISKVAVIALALP